MKKGLLFLFGIALTTFIMSCKNSTGGGGVGDSRKLIATYKESTGEVGATIKFYSNDTFLVENVKSMSGNVTGDYNLKSDKKSLTLTIKKGTDMLESFVAPDVDVPFNVLNNGQKIKVAVSSTSVACPAFIQMLEYDLQSGSLTGESDSNESGDSLSGGDDSSSGGDGKYPEKDPSEGGGGSSGGGILIGGGGSNSGGDGKYPEKEPSIDDTYSWGDGDTSWYSKVSGYSTFKTEHLVKALLDSMEAKQVNYGGDFAISYTYYEDEYYGDPINKTLYYAVKPGIESFVIPGNFTKIDARVFSNQSWLKYIEIPASITEIGEYAFSGCALDTINYCGSIEKWCEISICYALKYDLNNPSKLLFNYEEVTDLAIPSTVTTICSRAFYNCANFSSVYIPSSVKSIGENAFRGCIGLVTAYFEMPEEWTFYSNWEGRISAYIYNDYSTAENLIGRNGCSQDWTSGLYCAEKPNYDYDEEPNYDYDEEPNYDYDEEPNYDYENDDWSYFAGTYVANVDGYIFTLRIDSDGRFSIDTNMNSDVGIGNVIYDMGNFYLRPMYLYDDDGYTFLDEDDLMILIYRDSDNYVSAIYVDGEWMYRE